MQISSTATSVRTPLAKSFFMASMPENSVENSYQSSIQTSQVERPKPLQALQY